MSTLTRRIIRYYSYCRPKPCVPVWIVVLSKYCKVLLKKLSTLAGLEPTRDKPNRFLVDRLNRSATVSLSMYTYLSSKYVNIRNFCTKMMQRLLTHTVLRAPSFLTQKILVQVILLVPKILRLDFFPCWNEKRTLFYFSCWLMVVKRGNDSPSRTWFSVFDMIWYLSHTKKMAKATAAANAVVNLAWYRCCSVGSFKITVPNQQTVKANGSRM